MTLFFAAITQVSDLPPRVVISIIVGLIMLSIFVSRRAAKRQDYRIAPEKELRRVQVAQKNLGDLKAHWLRLALVCIVLLVLGGLFIFGPLKPFGVRGAETAQHGQVRGPDGRHLNVTIVAAFCAVGCICLFVARAHWRRGRRAKAMVCVLAGAAIALGGIFLQ